ncbi:MAG: LacI family DNA-binding transcriptional regulator [Spirochaetales bacterium]|nr:MAG: LacI family DNA-binding transcriptional regulator [Spirochaetales bacterium]
MAVTVKDLARLAGVSIGTVDRVLHRRGRVAAETESRVRAVIGKTGFTLNLHASNLAQARNYRIGILTPELTQDSGFWRIPLAGMRSAVRELSHYHVNLQFHHLDRFSASSFREAAGALPAEKPDGILLAPVIPEAALEFVRNLPEEAVLCCFDSDLPGLRKASFIGQDSLMSGRLAGKLMKMLVPADRQTVIIQAVDMDYHIRDRVEGFRSRYPEDTRPTVFKEKHLDLPGVCDTFMDDLFRTMPDTGGIFVTNASVHRVADYLVRRNRAGVSLVGYDLIPENRKFVETGVIDFLISQRPEVQGYLGVQTLFNILSGQGKPPETQIVPLDILTRENIRYYAPDRISP